MREEKFSCDHEDPERPDEHSRDKTNPKRPGALAFAVGDYGCDEGSGGEDQGKNPRTKTHGDTDGFACSLIDKRADEGGKDSQEGGDEKGSQAQAHSPPGGPGLGFFPEAADNLFTHNIIIQLPSITSDAQASPPGLDYLKPVL